MKEEDVIKQLDSRPPYVRQACLTMTIKGVVQTETDYEWLWRVKTNGFECISLDVKGNRKRKQTYINVKFLRETKQTVRMK